MISAEHLESAAAVKVALDTLLFGLEDTLGEIRARAVEHVDSTTVSLVDRLASPVTRALTAVDVNLPGEGDTTPLDWSGVERAMMAVAESIAPHEAVLAQIADRAVASISAHTDALVPGTTDLLTALASALGNLINGLLGSLAEVPDFWSELYSTLREKFGEDKDPLTAFITDILHGMLNIAIERGAPVDGMPEAIMGRPRSEVPTGPQTVEDYIQQWANQPRIMRAFLNVVSMIPTVFALAGAMNASLISGVTQTALNEGKNTPLSSAELAQLTRRRDVDSDWASSHAGRSGVGRELFDLKYQLTQRLLDTQAILEYWRRTGDDNVLDELYRSGYEQDDVDRLKFLSLSVPTASDVVRFMARDVFDQDAIIAGGLNTDFDIKYREAEFNAAGVTRDTALLYWMAHWSLPSPTMGYEMLHRNVIDQAKLEELLKLADYAPGWIDEMVAISYNVPGRIDVRRMWETGVINDRPSLVRRYQDMGYSPEDADTLATFTETLTAKSRETEAERTRAPLVHAIVQQYAKSATDYDTAHGLLTDLGLTDNRATFVLQQGIFEREQDREQRIREAIKREYVKGFLSTDDAVSRLENYGFGDTEIAALFESWDLDRELAEESAEARHAKDLTKSEIIASYADRLIDRGSALASLQDMGYDPQESSTLLALEDAKIQKADNRVAEQAIHTIFTTRRAEAPETVSALQGLGYLPQRVAALMARWEVEREEKRPDLSSSQLEKMLLQGIVPEDRIEQLLTERGYAPEHIALLMTLWGTEKMVQSDALAEKVREFNIREARLTQQGAQRIGLTGRGLDIRERQFTQSQQGVQQRFDEGQAQQRSLQQQRLDAATAANATRIAAQTARDAASFQAARERQAAQIAAEAARLDRQVASAEARAAASIAERDKALAQHRDLTIRAQDAANARTAASIQAQADRLQVSVNAANARAEAARVQAANLQAAREDAATRLLDQRAHIQEARDIRQTAEALAKEQRAELTRVRAEQRATATKNIAAADVAANAAALQSLQLQQTSAIADLNARFAALQATLLQQRQQTLLDTKIAAERLLAAATPTSAFLEPAGM